MTTSTSPIIECCYIDQNSDMFKVKMLIYCGKEIQDILIEDLSGNIKLIDIVNWQNLRLIPCCYTGNRLNSYTKAVNRLIEG